MVALERTSFSPSSTQAFPLMLASPAGRSGPASWRRL